MSKIGRVLGFASLLTAFTSCASALGDAPAGGQTREGLRTTVFAVA